MIVDDLVEVAGGLDNSLLRLQELYRKDLREHFKVCVTLPKDEMALLDRDLYVTQNGGLAGFTPSDEVRARILGIDFVISPEEETTEQS